jgi:tetratricopeptide (TPR) repeat protein
VAKLTDGLYGYEVAMLWLGILLFIVLLFGLIARLRKGDSVASLLPFFGVAIAMIGYPSVQSITIGKDLLSIQKATHDLTVSPTNLELRQSINATLQKIQSRPIGDPSNLTMVATAQYALGDDSAAKQNLQKALAVNPNIPAAKALQQKIGIVETVTNLTNRVQLNPGDAQARTALQSTVSDAGKLPIANPNALTEIARGQAAMGDYSQAIANANKAAHIDPNGPGGRLAQSLKLSRPENNAVAIQR